MPPLSSVVRYFLILVLTLASIAFANVEFTTPAPGASVPVGTIDVRWKESGTGTPIADLRDYTLALLVGGNNKNDMLQVTVFVSEGDFATGNDANGTIPAGIAGPVSDGFFFQMMSTSATGHNIINYSERFSITGLTGVIDPKYRDAAAALNGATAGPAEIDGRATPSSTTSAPTATSKSNSESSKTTNPTITVTAHASAKTSQGVALANDVAPTQGGLSVAAKAGIGAATATVGIALISLGICLFVRRRAKRQAGEPGSDMIYLDHKAELSGDLLSSDSSTTGSRGFNGSAVVVEADDGERPSEMDSSNIRAELEGDYVHGVETPIEGVHHDRRSQDQSEVLSIDSNDVSTYPSDEKTPPRESGLLENSWADVLSHVTNIVTQRSSADQESDSPVTPSERL